MKRSKGLLAAVAAAAFIATGCTAKDEPFEATFTPATHTPAASSPTPALIVADPAIMGSMTCEPVSRDALSTLAYGPDATRAIQVEAGEGLEPGSRWWVVVMDLPEDRYHGWPPRRVQFLTDAPSGGGKWIPLGDPYSGQDPSDPWTHVSWDPERLIRAQSALTRAAECLGRQA